MSFPGSSQPVAERGGGAGLTDPGQHRTPLRQSLHQSSPGSDQGFLRAAQRSETLAIQSSFLPSLFTAVRPSSPPEASPCYLLLPLPFIFLSWCLLLTGPKQWAWGGLARLGEERFPGRAERRQLVRGVGSGFSPKSICLPNPSGMAGVWAGFGEG